MAFDVDLHARCNHHLSRHKRMRPGDALMRYAELKNSSLPQDLYCTGGAVEKLEHYVADLLGIESALFFSTGTIAQNSALKVHCDAAGKDRIVLHPMSHINRDTEESLAYLTGVEPCLVGNLDPYTVEEVLPYIENAGAISIELPLRRSGYLLTEWAELKNLSQLARRNGVAVHIDGARIWESSAGYDRSLKEIGADVRPLGPSPVR